MNSQVRLYFILINFAIAIALMFALNYGIRSWGNVTAIEKKQNSSLATNECSKFVELPKTNIFQAANEVVIESPLRQSSGELSKRFRLAGTLFGTQNFGAVNPAAIIDDKQMVKSYYCKRGDEIIPGVTVVEIKNTSVILRDAAGEEELFIEKLSTTVKPAISAESKQDSDTSVTQEDAIKHFGGVEVYPNRWEFDRESVMNYYDELMKDGERMLSVFDSMDPVYVTDENGVKSITGYVVGVEGEHDFFAASGLKNGDIVRAVNSTPMANRTFAENFIKEFVNNQTEMFVLDVERDGKIEKLIYTIK